MGFAFVQAKAVGAANASSATTLAVTFSAAVTSGNIVIGIATNDSGGGGTVSSITDDGTGGTWVVKRNTNDATDQQNSASFYGYGWSSPPTTITVHYSVSVAARAVSVQEFSGQASGNPIDGTNEQGQNQQTPGTGTDGCKSGAGALTPSADNYLVWGGCVNTGGGTTGSSQFTHGTSFTINANAENTTSGQTALSSEYWIQTTATAANSSFTVPSNVAHTTMMMIFKAAAGGGGSTFVPLIGGPGGVAGMPLAGVGGGLIG